MPCAQGTSTLSPEDRVRLADRLIASVFEDEDIEPAWSVEVEKRIADIEAGGAALIPASQAIAARLTYRYGAQRNSGQVQHRVRRMTPDLRSSPSDPWGEQGAG